jgi:hypothetical protein
MLEILKWWGSLPDGASLGVFFFGVLLLAAATIVSVSFCRALGEFGRGIGRKK